MRRLATSVFAAVAVTLVGCGSVVKVENPDGYKRVAKSARVEFRTQNRVPLKVTRYTRVGVGSIDSKVLQKSQDEVVEFVRVVRAQTVDAVQAAMKERNIPPGDDATIYIEASEATHQGYMSLKLSVWTHFRDAPEHKRWIFTVDVSTDTREPLDAAATKAADAVARTLVKEGVLGGAAR